MNTGKPQKTEVQTDYVFDPRVSKSKLQTWFPDLSSGVVDRLVTYQSELVHESSTGTLIQKNSLRNAEALQIADGVLGCRIIERALISDAAVYDFGGALGLPGIVFSLLFPEREVILVERDDKKAQFYHQVGSKIQLANFKVKTGQIDDLPPESVSNAVTRGSVAMAQALLGWRRLFKKGGRLFHLKGGAWSSELAGIPSQLFSQWSPSLLGQYRVPGTTIDMAVVQTEKSK